MKQLFSICKGVGVDIYIYINQYIYIYIDLVLKIYNLASSCFLPVLLILLIEISF